MAPESTETTAPENQDRQKLIVRRTIIQPLDLPTLSCKDTNQVVQR
jgi:hypothetical protein